MAFLTSVPGRVRVAVRLRPKNAEESVADADFADCVELQPEVFFFFHLYLLHMNSEFIYTKLRTWTVYVLCSLRG